MPGLLPKKTVVPIDFSELSIEALNRALDIAAPDGDVQVIHVLAALSVMEPGLIYGTESDDERIKGALERLDETLADTKYNRVQKHVVVGDPGHEIADYAQESGADLIVIPSHGYGVIRHMLLGSVAERVVRLAHCPVLVLRK
jgi:nucleotide-binding universal stress UspA family protein